MTGLDLEERFQSEPHSDELVAATRNPIRERFSSLEQSCRTLSMAGQCGRSSPVRGASLVRGSFSGTSGARRWDAQACH